KNRKLVEGRYPNIHLSSEVHEVLNKKAEYIRKRGFDDKYYQDMILKYLEKYKKVSRQDIEILLLDKMGDILIKEQKRKKIANMLQKMRRNSLITKVGGKRFSNWILLAKLHKKI
ncbi:MAG: hypothetical protein KAR45_06260, partial [Desulfobacteraceae bacterium]|nr:hypothetical protein [Desulfobacteraceae bacterium]